MTSDLYYLAVGREMCGFSYICALLKPIESNSNTSRSRGAKIFSPSSKAARSTKERNQICALRRLFSSFL
jgi:hypothetical protein